MTSVEVFKNSPYLKCLSAKWIKVDKWDYFKNCLQEFFSLLYFSIQLFFLNMKPLSEARALYFGHSDSDPSSVTCFPLCSKADENFWNFSIQRLC
jgi:hypothetical protein